MPRIEVLYIALLISLLGLCPTPPVHAQSGTEADGDVGAQSGTRTPVTFVEEEKEAARQQLRRILSTYTLDDWIFTQKVVIKVGVDPVSGPILTLNTDYLDSDDIQLSIFLHEQAHWFVARFIPYPSPENVEDEVDIIRDLRNMYPDPPVPVGYRTYAHLIVAWAELDAMTEVVGESEARRILREKLDRIAGEYPPSIAKPYLWYNERALEDTEEIGELLRRYEMIHTPDKGLMVTGDAEQAENGQRRR
jgi:hypothetical protein